MDINGHPRTNGVGAEGGGGEIRGGGGVGGGQLAQSEQTVKDIVRFHRCKCVI